MNPDDGLRAFVMASELPEGEWYEIRILAMRNGDTVLIDDLRVWRKLFPVPPEFITMPAGRQPWWYSTPRRFRFWWGSSCMRYGHLAHPRRLGAVSCGLFLCRAWWNMHGPWAKARARRRMRRMERKVTP